MLFAIVDRAASRFEAAADHAEQEAEDRRPGDPAEALAALVRAHLEVLTDDVDEAGVFVHEWRALGPELRLSILARRDAYERRFRRHIEAAYTTMWQTWQRGEEPRGFSVDPMAT